MVGAVPDGTSATAERKAAREYLEIYHQAREGNMIMSEYRDSIRFHALRGLGEEAFACYYVAATPSNKSQTDAHGVIWFRVRNLLVEVTYSMPPGALAEDAVLKAAYRVSLDVAASLPAKV